MIDAMITEIKSSHQSYPHLNKEKIGTIYFGGGTPSLLNAEDLKKLLHAVYNKYNVTENVEITLEANPDDINEIKLKDWNSCGINRFSIGVQSFNQDDLAWMNRAHSAVQALNCIKQVKNAGFKNFSVDIIYGTPTLPDDAWEKNVETIVGLDVPHISCYALTVEPATALHKMILLKKKDDVNQDKQATQFINLMDWLKNAGYEHYEISNFAQPGYRSKHNSSYWQGKSYIGIGPSAHSFDGNVRRWNVSNNIEYIEAIKSKRIHYEEEILSDVQKLNEYIMTSLRTIEGIDLNLIENKFGKCCMEKLEGASVKHFKSNKLQIINHKLILTNEGKLLADGITADLFFEKEYILS